MKISYNANGLRSLSIAQAIAEVARAGYDGIELSLHKQHLDALTISPREVLAIGESLRQHQLTACCLATGADTLLSPERFEPSLVHPVPHRRQQRIDLIRRSIDLAYELAIPVVNFASGLRQPQLTASAAWDLLIGGVGLCCKHAAGKVGLAVVPEPGFFIGTNPQAGQLLIRADCPELRLNQDIGHVKVAEDDFLESVSQHLPLTAHIHVEDIRDRIHAHLIPGEGDIEFPEVCALLNSGGYSGFISVELYDHGAEYPRALRQSLRFLRALTTAAQPQSQSAAH